MFIVCFFEIVFSLSLNYEITVILYCMLFYLQYGVCCFIYNMVYVVLFTIWLNSFNSESKLISQITHIYI